MSSTDYVEFDVGKVNNMGWTETENAAWTELVRSLSSFSRAVVKYLPSNKSLLQYSEEVLVDAMRTADAELYFDAVCNKSPKDSTAAETTSTQAQFAEKTARIVSAKTKRLKQHSRRASARAKPLGNSATGVQGKAKWPALLAETAQNHQEWRVDLFMHISMIVVSKYLEDKGLLVNRTDNIRTKQQQKQIKKLLHFHSDEVGVACIRTKRIRIRL